MARSKKTSSARAASAAKAGAVEPATDDLDELTTAADPAPDTAAKDSTTKGSTAKDSASAGSDADDAAPDASPAGTGGAAAKDPVKRSRATAKNATAKDAKDPVPAKGSRKASGKSARKNAEKGSDTDSGTTTGSEVSEKAKDATRSTSPKKAAAAETARTGRRRVAAEAPNPAWLAPTAVAFLLLGLAYLVTFYLSGGTLPLPIGDWNLAAGFGVMLVGGGMLMFWK
ncbi:cell division protein CrgA [Brachybacterium tyrofermentans]|uniref:cell division protein CrgA n=1 Tax=Brachybacterium tyrofermentans TaxID=47848 RepID=UPI00186960F1|nr:cell division protein CrgA [Brachybacterium tyrofermentans]